jgi:rhodanese-related sulfurtransferase
MPWIENVSLGDIPKGRHHNAGENSMLIQIVDPGMEFPTPMHRFKETHQFEFLDVEEKDEVLEEAMRCSHEQAEQLVKLLQHALDKRMNVVVHCVAGVCRSGAVCELGVMLGFDDCEGFRSPNLLVKHRMMKVLGWLYDENEPHTINGIGLDPDWTNDNEKVFTLAHARRERRLRERDGDI